MNFVSDELLRALRDTLESDSQKVKSAEQVLHFLAMKNDFALQVLQLLINVDVDMSCRLAAGVQLRQYLSQHWDQERAPEESLFNQEEGLSEQMRQTIRHLLLTALENIIRQAPNSRLNDVLNSCIAKIAVTDWPEKWDEIMSQFILPALSNASNQEAFSHAIAASALDILYEMSGEISHFDVLKLIPHTFPSLIIIFNDKNGPSLLRRKALGVMNVLIEALDSQDKTVKNQIGQQLMEAFFESLVNEICGQVADSADLYALHYYGYQLLIQLQTMFEKLLQPHADKILQVFGPTFLRTVNLYEATYVYGHSKDADDELVDAVGNVHNLINVLDYQLSFLRKLLSSLSENNQKAILPDAFAALLQLAQPTEEQVDLWLSDVDEYLISCDRDSCLTTLMLRRQVLEFLEELDYSLPDAIILDGFSPVANKLIIDFQNTDTYILGSKWKIHEAFLYVVFNFTKPITTTRKPNEQLIHHVTNYTEKILVPALLNATVHPLLRASGFRCFSALSVILPPHLQTYLWRQVFETCCLLLVNDTQNSTTSFSGSGSILLCAASLQCLQFLLEKLQRREMALKSAKEDLLNLVKQNFLPLVQSVTHTMGQVGLPVIPLGLRFLSDLLQLDHELAAQSEPQITDTVMNIFDRFYQHSHVVQLCCIIIEDLCRNRYCDENLQSRILPRLIHLLGSGHNTMQDIVLQVVLDLLTHVLAPSVAGTSDAMLQALLPNLYRLSLESVDSIVVERVVNCLAILMTLYPRKLLSIRLTDISLCPVDTSLGSLQQCYAERHWVIPILSRCFSPTSESGDVAWYSRGSTLCRALLMATRQPVDYAPFSGRQEWLPSILTAVVARLTAMNWKAEWPKEESIQKAKECHNVAIDHRDPSVLIAALRGCLLIFIHLLYESASLSDPNNSMYQTNPGIRPLPMQLFYLNTLTDLKGTSSLLPLVIRMWCDYENILFEPSHTQMSIYTMCALLRHCIESNDSLLQEIIVNGDEIHSTSDKCSRVQTRSTTKERQYEKIPSVVKFFKVLVNEMHSLRESARTNNGEGDDDDDDSDDNPDGNENTDDCGDYDNGKKSDTEEQSECEDEDDDEDGGGSSIGRRCTDVCEDLIYKNEPFRVENQLENLTNFFQQLSSQNFYPVFLQHVNPLERNALRRAGALPRSL